MGHCAFPLSGSIRAYVPACSVASPAFMCGVYAQPNQKCEPEPRAFWDCSGCTVRGGGWVGASLAS
eukprot:5029242-Prymnesium_polylepis.1